MAIKTGEYLNENDVYIDYPFEGVMFRCIKKGGPIYRKFYGETESPHPIPDENRLFNDALLSGDEITQEEYELGKSS